MGHALTQQASYGGDATHIVNYVYDAFNRRVAKSIDSDGDGSTDERVYYLHDGLRADRDSAGDHVVLALNAAGEVTNRYLHGPAVDQILADEQIDTTASPPTSRVLWPLTDHQGTVRDVAEYDEVTGETEIVNHITYDAFGNVTGETNAAVDHLFGFTGREGDEESDLYYYRARFYDAAPGQFMSEDPLGFEAGDRNLRRYVGNDGVNGTDPSGLGYWFENGINITPGGDAHYDARDHETPGERRWMRPSDADMQAKAEAYNKRPRRQLSADLSGVEQSSTQSLIDRENSWRWHPLFWYFDTVRTNLSRSDLERT